MYVSVVPLTIYFLIRCVPQQRAHKLVPWIVLVFLCILSTQKEITGDSSVYKEYLEYLRKVDLATSLSHTFISIRPFEFCFVSLSYISLLAGPYDILFLIAACTFLVYISTYYTIFNLFTISDNNEHLKSNKILIISVLFAFLISINFSWVVYLLRQYLGISFFFLSLSFFFKRRYSVAIFILALSVGFHISTLALVAIAAIAGVSMRLFIVAPVAALTIGLAAQPILNELDLIAATFSKDDGSVPTLLIALDIILISSYITLCVFLGRFSKWDNFFINLLIIYIGFLFFTQNYSLLFLRFYVVVDIIRALVFCSAITKIDFLFYRWPFLLILFLGLFSFFYRFSQNPWTFTDNSSSLLSISLVDIINRITINVVL